MRRTPSRLALMPPAAIMTAALALPAPGHSHIQRAHPLTAGPSRPEAAAARPARRHVTVRRGDTLWGIAAHVLGSASEWPILWWDSRWQIGDPDAIRPGQRLAYGDWRHVKPWLARAAYAAGRGGGAARRERARQAAKQAGTAPPAQPAAAHAGGGTLGCPGLEQLWLAAGGSAASEVTAASVAMAESGGDQWATGAAGERGYWQISPVHGALSTYNPYGNARAAVILSGDGANWSAWTTFTSGAYAGRC